VVVSNQLLASKLLPLVRILRSRVCLVLKLQPLALAVHNLALNLHLGNLGSVNRQDSQIYSEEASKQLHLDSSNSNLQGCLDNSNRLQEGLALELLVSSLRLKQLQHCVEEASNNLLCLEPSHQLEEETFSVILNQVLVLVHPANRLGVLVSSKPLQGLSLVEQLQISQHSQQLFLVRNHSNNNLQRDRYLEHSLPEVIYSGARHHLVQTRLLLRLAACSEQLLLVVPHSSQLQEASLGVPLEPDNRQHLQEVFSGSLSKPNLKACFL